MKKVARKDYRDYWSLYLIDGNQKKFVSGLHRTKAEALATKEVDIYGDTKTLNLCKKMGIQYRESKEWNGYGYKITGRFISITDYRRILKILSKRPKIKVRDEGDKELSRCRRLMKLTGISLAQAEEIANEKKEYKDRKIEEMEERNCNNPSRMREKLIKKMERENPLRYIKDVCHATAILVASDRHTNTNYESLLEEARDLASWGEIDKSEVKAYARTHAE